MNRATVTIILILILIIGGGVAWYFLKPLSVPTAPTGKTNELPDIGGRAGVGGSDADGSSGSDMGSDGSTAPGVSLRQIIDKPILTVTLSADGKSLYYLLRENGHIMASSLDGTNERQVTNLTILETFDGLWSPKKTKLAVWYAENGIAKAFLHETATSSPSRVLPSGITSLAWSPDGLNIAYLVPQGAKTNLMIADANNKNARTIYSTPIPDFTVQWAAKKSILLVSRPSGLAPSLVISINPDTKASSVVLSGMAGVITSSLPNGSGFLFSQSDSNGKATALSLYTFKDSLTTTINQITIAEKCVFSPDSKKLYCGIPQSAIQNPSPDTWYRGEISFSDAIVEIDLATNRTTTLTNASIADIDAISFFTTADGNNIFFIDKKTSTLWRVTLGQ